MQSLHRIARSARLSAFIAANLESHTARWTLARWSQELDYVTWLRAERLDAERAVQS